MFEIELISFVDHDAADSYEAFTPVSAHHCNRSNNWYSLTTGRKAECISWSAGRGGQSREGTWE